MTTAWDENMRLNIRKTKSQQITHFILNALRDFIPYECQGQAADELYKLLYDNGAEIITDYTRTEFGLPPRGPDGWTMEELHALEAKRLELMTKPIQPMFLEKN